MMSSKWSWKIFISFVLILRGMHLYARCFICGERGWAPFPFLLSGAGRDLGTHIFSLRSDPSVEILIDI